MAPIAPKGLVNHPLRINSAIFIMIRMVTTTTSSSMREWEATLGWLAIFYYYTAHYY